MESDDSRELLELKAFLRLSLASSCSPIDTDTDSADSINDLLEMVTNKFQTDEFVKWVRSFYPEENPCDNQPILFLIALQNELMIKYDNDFDQAYFIDSNKKEYANELKEFNALVSQSTLRQSIKLGIQLCTVNFSQFSEMFQTIENKNINITKLFSGQPEIVRTWSDLIDRYARQYPFVYKSEFAFDNKEKKISKIEFPISTNQTQELLFKSKLTEKEAVDRVCRWWSKPLSQNYFEYIEEDMKAVGITWDRLPRKWTARWHTLSSEMQIVSSIIKIESNDKGHYRLVFHNQTHDNK